MEKAFREDNYDLVRKYQSVLGLPLMQRLPSEGPASPAIQEPEQPVLPSTVSTRRERTRERRAPALETPSLTQEPTSQTPERAPSLAPQPPPPPQETLSEPPRETLSMQNVPSVPEALEAVTALATPVALVAEVVVAPNTPNTPIDTPANTLRVLPIR